MKIVKFRINEIIVKSKNIIPNKKVFLLLSKKLWNECIIKNIIKRTVRNINIELLIIAISVLPMKVAMWIAIKGAIIPNNPNIIVKEALPPESLPNMFNLSEKLVYKLDN